MFGKFLTMRTEVYYNEETAKSVSPRVIIISAGPQNNTTTAEAKYKKFTKFTFNTERHGNIVISANKAGYITCECEFHHEDFK